MYTKVTPICLNFALCWENTVIIARLLQRRRNEIGITLLRCCSVSHSYCNPSMLSIPSMYSKRSIHTWSSSSLMKRIICSCLFRWLCGFLSPVLCLGGCKLFLRVRLWRRPYSRATALLHSKVYRRSRGRNEIAKSIVALRYLHSDHCPHPFKAWKRVITNKTRRSRVLETSVEACGAGLFR